MRQYPYARLLRFLVANKADLGLTLRSLELPPLDWKETADLKASLQGSARPPIADAWLRGREVPVPDTEDFLSWAAVHGFRELWERRLGRGDDHLEVACRTFANPALRTIVATLLMAEFDAVEVRELVYAKYRTKLSSEGVELFRVIFWDTQVMTTRDWAQVLDELPKDQRALLAIAFGDLGKDGIKVQLGIVPEIDLGAILGDVAATAYQAARLEMQKPLPDLETFSRMARLAVLAAEKKKRFGGGPSRSLAEEVQMQLRHADDKIPSLAELQAEEDGK